MSSETDFEFLEQLLDAAAPSGFESRAARVWTEHARSFADEVRTDVHGSSVAIINPSGTPRVMLAGHIDEIGLQVTHIDEDGFLYVDEIGGWDPQVVVGQRVRILGSRGDVIGVVGKKAIHLIKPEDRKKAAEVGKLWVDVGVGDRAEATEMGLRVGDPMVVDASLVRLAGDRIASRAVDDRVGAYVVLQALRRLAKERPNAAVMAVATVQEEIGGFSGGGARSSAFALEPDVAIAVDVTFSTDVPDAEKRELGEHTLGGGPVLTRGSSANPVVFDRLVEAAENADIPYSIQAAPKATRTDADAIFQTRSGVATGLVSIPNRYMHSPNEVVSLSDLDRTVRLLEGFVRGLESEVDFTPR